MCHKLLADTSLWFLLLQIDRDIAAGVQARGCPCCGGRLDVSDYPRKPRGALVELPEEYRQRLSFSCAREGCRKRATPPSVRFLGQKVFLGAVVVLVSALRQGPSPSASRRLEELFEVSRHTIARWQGFWQETFPATAFWKTVKDRFASLAHLPLPLRLVRAFGPLEHDPSPFSRLLRFLSPISTRSSFLRKDFEGS